MNPADLQADVRNAIVLLQLLDKVYPGRIDPETTKLLQDLEQNDLALAALLKGAELLQQLDTKLPRR
jgi:hypothetical protein